jgi:ketosteroid isomerase-like protein
MRQWFDGLNCGDSATLLPLFSPECRIHNAANPPDETPGAAERLLTDLFRRTEARSFSLVDVAVAGRSIHACWTGILVFRRGVTIAGVTLPAQMPVLLSGVDVFEIDDSNRIARLFITHETTSVVAAARALAAATSATLPVESLVCRYFQAEEVGDTDAIVEMCDDRVVILNAAQPPVYGHEGARQFAEDFRNRTEERHFEIRSLAVNGYTAFAEFLGRLLSARASSSALRSVPENSSPWTCRGSADSSLIRPAS